MMQFASRVYLGLALGSAVGGVLGQFVHDDRPAWALVFSQCSALLMWQGSLYLHRLAKPATIPDGRK